MAYCLTHRYRGLAVLVRSYRVHVCCTTAWCQGHRGDFYRKCISMRWFALF